MSRSRTEERKTDLRSFAKNLREKRGFTIEFPFGTKAIEQHCGKGIYQVVENVLLLSKHRHFRFVFEEGKKAAWPSDVKDGYIVVNFASLSRFEESITQAIKGVSAEEGVLK